MKKRLVMVGCCILMIGCGGKTIQRDEQGRAALAPCGITPNCVSSQNRPGKNRIEPFVINSSVNEAMKKLKTIISDMPGSTLIEEEPHYLYVQFKSKLFGFIDDVEFLADEKAGQIYVRSASRVGLSDFGVNRRRIEKIRFEYNH